MCFGSFLMEVWVRVWEDGGGKGRDVNKEGIGLEGKVVGMDVGGVSEVMGVGKEKFVRWVKYLEKG